MASVQWKKERNLKVSGSTIKQGVFRGWQSASLGGVKTQDLPCEFTPEYIDKLYKGINGHIPIIVGHDGDKRPVGYTYQHGVTLAKDDIQFKGFVFDERAEQKIIREGYNFVSPEIVEETDSSGNVTPKLLYIALVKNPAISGTDINVEPIMFSKGEEDMTEGNEETPATPKDESFGKGGKQPEQKNNSLDINVNVKERAPPVDDKPKQGNDVTLEVAELKAKNVLIEKQLDKMLTERYEGIVAELKKHDIEEPEKIVKGLPTDQKITILSNVLSTVVKTKPPADTKGITPPPPDNSNKKAEIDKAVAETLEELGFTVDEYKELRGEK